MLTNSKSPDTFALEMMSELQAGDDMGPDASVSSLSALVFFKNKMGEVFVVIFFKIKEKTMENVISCPGTNLRQREALKLDGIDRFVVPEAGIKPEEKVTAASVDFPGTSGC